MRSIVASLVLFLVASSGSAPLARAQVIAAVAPETQNDGWSTGTLESAGLSTKLLSDMSSANREAAGRLHNYRRSASDLHSIAAISFESLNFLLEKVF
jgi:hypothetical protein